MEVLLVKDEDNNVSQVCQEFDIGRTSTLFIYLLYETLETYKWPIYKLPIQWDSHNSSNLNHIFDNRNHIP